MDLGKVTRTEHVYKQDFINNSNMNLHFQFAWYILLLNINGGALNINYKYQDSNIQRPKYVSPEATVAHHK